jgi:hypothetical protein
MSRDRKIGIARAVRNWDGGVAEITLVWNVFYSKLIVEYREEHKTYGARYQEPPDYCVKHWLRHFVRPQGHLQPDSYHITKEPCAAWREIIEGILKRC